MDWRYALVAVSFLMSTMFPTIFALGTKGLARGPRLAQH